tara:strand:- start:828 stop:1091 length:264 start_codon:yes stop_codon:yes gene_type:complete
MFRKFFRANYRSRKTISIERVSELESEITELRDDNKKREKQIGKFLMLIEAEPEYQKKYLERIEVHKQFMMENNKRIEEIQDILLDK